MTDVSVTINGTRVTADVEPRTHLADFLRERQNLTGTHVGCEHGVCGACTVELDGEIIRSCITYTVAVDGAAVRTIEGFESDPLMARLRVAFTEEHALQCGYCTPGMLIAARDLIRRRGKVDESTIREAMSGNLCRCTGYVGIVRAIAKVMAAEDLDAMRPALGDRDRQWRGPAPGPAAMAGHARTVAETGVGRRTTTPAVAAATPRPSPGKRIEVVTSPVRKEAGYDRLTQNFTLDHPVEEVWTVLSDLRSAIGCVPGARLETAPDDTGAFKAIIAVSLGPIRTSFAGQGTFRVDPAARRGTLEGRGSDQGSPSQADGKLSFSLSDAGNGRTRVETEIAYALTGPLAQFNRPALVAALVGSLGTSFAESLNARLSGFGQSEGTATASTLGLWALIKTVVAAWIRSAIGR